MFALVYKSQTELEMHFPRNVNDVTLMLLSVPTQNYVGPVHTFKFDCQKKINRLLGSRSIGASLDTKLYRNLDQTQSEGLTC